MNQEPPKIIGAQITSKAFAAVIITMIAAVFSLILWLWFVPPEIVANADAGFKRAKKTIDCEQLRAWALESIKHQPTTNSWKPILESEIPAYITSLYSTPPEDAMVIGNTVVISWGGGFFHWFIEVGPTNYQRETGASSGYQVAEWTRGIYYGHEGNRKIK